MRIRRRHCISDFVCLLCACAAPCRWPPVAQVARLGGFVFVHEMHLLCCWPALLVPYTGIEPVQGCC